MLKKLLFHPPGPKRAETRSFPGFVLGSSQSSTYPTRVRLRLFSRLRPCSGRGASWRAWGRVGVIGNLFEHPAAVWPKQIQPTVALFFGSIYRPLTAGC